MNKPTKVLQPRVGENILQIYKSADGVTPPFLTLQIEKDGKPLSAVTLNLDQTIALHSLLRQAYPFLAGDMSSDGLKGIGKVN